MSIDPKTWVFLSRMHQLALELNAPGLKAMRMPILRAMHLEGLIDTELRGTVANKRTVLAAMVEQHREATPGWEPSESIKRALGA